jgi:hypothetical protein
MLLDELLWLDSCGVSLWGIGCSLAILYSIYLGGYRKAVKDSLKPEIYRGEEEKK